MRKWFVHFQKVQNCYYFSIVVLPCFMFFLSFLFLIGESEGSRFPIVGRVTGQVAEMQIYTDLFQFELIR